MIRENLKWDLKLEGVRESELDSIRVKDVKFNGTLHVKDLNTGISRTVFLPDRVYTKISSFVKNKNANDLVFCENRNNNIIIRNNDNYRNQRGKKRICLAE